MEQGRRECLEYTDEYDDYITWHERRDMTKKSKVGKRAEMRWQ